MDDRSMQPGSPELPLRPIGEGTVGDGPARHPLEDPRALTILTTEHWSLLSARGLVYNEAFARGGMFLTFLSASLVALGLVAGGTGFSPQLRVIALILLSLDLFIGLATLGRVAAASGEDIRCLQGMNRIRHAYQETVPGLERYFVTSAHDDIAGVFAIYDAPSEVTATASMLHGFTTTPGMIAVIDAAIAAVLVGIVVLSLTESSVPTILAAVVTFAAGLAASVMVMTRSIRAATGSLRSLFPSPPPAR